MKSRLSRFASYTDRGDCAGCSVPKTMLPCGVSPRLMWFNHHVLAPGRQLPDGVFLQISGCCSVHTLIIGCHIARHSAHSIRPELLLELRPRHPLVSVDANGTCSSLFGMVSSQRYRLEITGAKRTLRIPVTGRRSSTTICIQIHPQKGMTHVWHQADE